MGHGAQSRDGAWLARDTVSSSLSGTADNVVQARDVSGGVHYHTVDKPRQTPLPRQLPIDTMLFGRDEQVADLLELADGISEAGSPGTVAISLINGMAGIGKTALAVHIGHLLAERFPDGQLIVDLHAHATDAGPRDPADTLGQILQALGLDPQAIPASLEDRAKVYRSRLAGSRTLIVLDDAADEQQVRPLLPAGAGCFVLVTSRNRLKGLDEAYPLPLDVLNVRDAVALFVRYAGAGRIAADDPAIRQIAKLCGRLPLALRISAAILRHRGTWTPSHLEERLRAGVEDLAVFDDGSRTVAAAFDLSYNTLTPRQQQMFRRLGLVPGPDTDAYAATALMDASLDEADALLQELTDRSLLTETIPGRYRLHDLLRLHACARAETDDSPASRDAAVGRLLDYYQYIAGQAGDLLEARIPTHPIPQPATVPRYCPALEDRQLAATWLAEEVANLTAAARYAATSPHVTTHAFRLPAALHEYLRTHGPWTQAIDLHATAALSADTVGDRLGQAGALNNVGAVRRLTGDYTGAEDAHRQALTLYQDLGDQLGQANALNYLGAVLHLTGDYSAAESAHRQAFTLYEDLGERLGQANALNYLGAVRRLVGDYSGAEHALRQALMLYQDLGASRGQANALNYLGAVLRLVGDYSGAEDALRQDLTLYQDLDDRGGQANALNELGALRRLVGDYPGAEDALRQALTLYRDLGAPRGQALAMNNLGAVLRLTGDYSSAEVAHRQALTLFRDLGERGNEASTLALYAAVPLASGDVPRALEMYRLALEMAREVRQPDDEALALEGIGECLVHTGHRSEATTQLLIASEIFHRLGMKPDVLRVNARIARLDGS